MKIEVELQEIDIDECVYCSWDYEEPNPSGTKKIKL